MLKNLLLITVFISLTACEKTVQEYHHSSLHFGTLIDITLYDVSESQADEAFKQLDKDFSYMHSAWSPWESGSVGRTNNLLKTGATFSIGPGVLELIKKSAAIANNTEQLFNPAIGELINLWQIHKHDDPDIKPPENKLIEQLIKNNPRLDDIKIEGVKIQTDNPHVLLNFGAFAKGYAIDLEIEMLKNRGIKNAIINTGGDLKAIGSHGDRPWYIAIRHPRLDTWIAKIEASNDESVFTSGDYERFYQYQGKRYHHILDPRTGYPAQGVQSVTVLHTDSGLADAAATALFVAGPDKWQEIANNLHLKQVMLIDSKGVVHVTPAMKKRLKFNSQIDTTILTATDL
ncbi:MAG: thiamine biosynthesis protein ApbE [endosymbiont of Galathealinum brachiosum]|uniref:FAD:protein FMN transferase n=1 Tax=endosymbiont of Galathealinum brachiosum TaxID=2200906 RepID=A0A370DEW0_9GAMM|nr:MAG: thiamine biosynthesis protein ApbE [endosymbiont of Galathealinum brachiosum]